MASRLQSVAASATMALVALVVAHDLIFLVDYGRDYGTALARTGHAAAWTAAVELVLLAGWLGTLLAIWQLRRLSKRVSRGAPANPSEPLVRPFLHRWLALASKLLAVTAVLFLVQENIERLQVGLALPGLGALLPPDQPFGLPILAAVAAAVSLVGALFGWRFAVLRERLRAASQAHRGAPARAPRPHSSDQPRPGRRLGRGLAVRAPPQMAFV